jgi:hypothetical protein
MYLVRMLLSIQGNQRRRKAVIVLDENHSNREFLENK